MYEYERLAVRRHLVIFYILYRVSFERCSPPRPGIDGLTACIARQLESVARGQPRHEAVGRCRHSRADAIFPIERHRRTLPRGNFVEIQQLDGSGDELGVRREWRNRIKATVVGYPGKGAGLAAGH